MAFLNAGSLDREFTLQSPNCDAANLWNDVETVWGSINYAGGSEAIKAGVPMSSGTFEVIIRYRTDLQGSWRIFEALSGRALQIISFGDPDGDQEALRVICVEAQ